MRTLSYILFYIEYYVFDVPPLASTEPSYLTKQSKLTS